MMPTKTDLKPKKAYDNKMDDKVQMGIKMTEKSTVAMVIAIETVVRFKQCGMRSTPKVPAVAVCCSCCR